MAEISVVIPVLNEAGNLGGLLADLDHQTLPPAEVIVVDAGSSDGTRELLRERESQRLRVIESVGATPGRGRNLGIATAGTPLIATIDAGSRVEGGWLDVLSAPLRAGGPEQRVCVGDAVADARSDFERAAGWLALRSYKQLGRRRPTGQAYIPAGRNGLCFPRRAWEQAGGYPEELATGEDKLFLQRLQGLGVSLTPVPEAIVRWRPRPTLRALYRQYRGYGYGDAVAAIDRRNEVIPILTYSLGAALAVTAATGRGWAAIALGLAALSYLALFVVPAQRELGGGATLLWIPLARVTMDLAKIHGFLAGLRARLIGGA